MLHDLPKEVKRDIIDYLVDGSGGWSKAVLEDVKSTYDLYEAGEISTDDVDALEIRMRDVLFAALERGEL